MQPKRKKPIKFMYYDITGIVKSQHHFYYSLSHIIIYVLAISLFCLLLSRFDGISYLFPRSNSALFFYQPFGMLKEIQTDPIFYFKKRGNSHH